MFLACHLIPTLPRPGCLIMLYVRERVLFEVEVWLELRCLTHTTVKNTVHYNTDVGVGQGRTNSPFGSCFWFLHLLNIWGRVLLKEKLRGSQLVKKFSLIYTTRSLIVFVRACDGSLTQVR